MNILAITNTREWLDSTERLTLIGFGLFLTIFMAWMRTRAFMLRREVALFTCPATSSATTQIPNRDALIVLLRSYHWSLHGYLTESTHILTLITGFIVVGYLRDVYHFNVLEPLLGVCIFSGLAAWIANRFSVRRIRELMAAPTSSYCPNLDR